MKTTGIPINDANALYEARLKRISDAISLRKPDRVPIASLAGFFLTRYSGISNAEAMYDYRKMAEAWKKALLKLNWDMSPPTYLFLPAPVMELLGLKTYRWPCTHLSDNHPYQYNEGEYMMADEYDELLNCVDHQNYNPSDYKALGFAMGKIVDGRTPVFVGLPAQSHIEALKGISAPILTMNLQEAIFSFHFTIMKERPWLSGTCCEGTQTTFLGT